MITELAFKLDANMNPRVPATLTNPQNNKTIKLDLLFDSGASTSVIDAKFARILGLKRTGEIINVNQSHSGGGLSGFYLAPLMLKIGTLKPLATEFLVEGTGSGNNANLELAIVGNRTMLQFKRVTYTGTGRIRIEDNTPTTAKAAYVHVYTDYLAPRWNRKRI